MEKASARGRTAAVLASDNHASVTDTDGGAQILFRGKPIALELSVPGAHNILNATGALLKSVLNS